MKKTKCPKCLNITGWVNLKDYCKKHATEPLMQGKIGIINFSENQHPESSPSERKGEK